MIATPESGALAALALCAVLVLVNLASLAVAAARIGRRGKPSAFPPGAPVSVVRPLRGLEAFSEETLRASFRLDYPEYELVFCVADAGDPILPMLELIAEQDIAVSAEAIYASAGSPSPMMAERMVQQTEEVAGNC